MPSFKPDNSRSFLMIIVEYMAKKYRELLIQYIAQTKTSQNTYKIKNNVKKLKCPIYSGRHKKYQKYIKLL